MTKRPVLIELVDELELSRESENFFQERFQLAGRTAYVMAYAMGTGGKKTADRLLYSSKFHDIILLRNPSLASIQNLKELDTRRSEFSDAECKLFINHPKLVSEMIADDPVAPHDASKIVLQHHEMPDSSGFPARLASNKILPIAVVLNISISFAQYVIANNDWSVEQFAQMARERLLGQENQKYQQVLELLKPSK